MRIAVVGPVPPIRGGIARHTANVVNALERSGSEVVVHTWAAQYPGLLYRRPQMDSTVEAMQGAIRSLRWWDPISWLRTANQIRAFDPAWVFLPWVTPFHAIALRVLIRRVRRPVVVHVHNALPHESFPFTGALTRLALGKVDRVVVHSTTIADELAELGVERPTLVTPHPPNLDLVPTPLPTLPPLRLLFLGFVRPYKGVDLAAEALSMVGPEVYLTVAGEFWIDVDAFRRYIDSLGLTGRVTIIDAYLPEQEIRELLASHHVVVAPYRSATQSGIVPLAFASGRPVIATRVGGLEEALIDGVNGVLADAHPRSIALAIEFAGGHIAELEKGAMKAGTTWAEYVDTAFATGPMGG